MTLLNKLYNFYKTIKNYILYYFYSKKNDDNNLYNDIELENIPVMSDSVYEILESAMV